MADTEFLTVTNSGWEMLAQEGQTVLIQSDGALIYVYASSAPDDNSNDGHLIAGPDRNGRYTYSGVSMGNLYVKAASPTEDAYIAYTIGG